MGLGDWLKKTYGKVDASVFGGHLPGGATPGMPYISVGDNVSSAPQPGTTSSFNGSPSQYGGGAPPYVFQTTSNGVAPSGGPDTSNVPTGGIGGWLSNPGNQNIIKYGTEALGLGLNAYEAGQNRNQTQAQLDLANKQAQQEMALQQQQYQLNALNAQRQFEGDTAERMRRRAAIQQIIGMNKTDATGGNARATAGDTTGAGG